MPPTHNDYRKMHQAFKDLGIEKYQFLNDRYGVDSAKMLTRFQLEDMYKHFKSLGWKPVRKKMSPVYDEAIHRKIVAMWIDLAQAKVVKNKSDKALQAYVKRMTGIANLKWCDGEHCRVLIESLKRWGERYDVYFD